MGWLSVNRTREELKSYKDYRSSTIKLRREGQTNNDNKRMKLEETGSLLPQLPKELVEMIFIYSNNLNLAFTSKQLMFKLCPDWYLESKFLEELIVDGVAPISVVTLPFMTVKLLENLKIKQFDNMHIPLALIDSKRRSSDRLIIYLLQNGCALDDGARCYIKFLNNGNSKAIKVLIQHLVPTNSLVVQRAVEQDHKYAAKMAELLPETTNEQDLSQLWSFSQSQGANDVIERLGALV